MFGTVNRNTWSDILRFGVFVAGGALAIGGSIVSLAALYGLEASVLASAILFGTSVVYAGLSITLCIVAGLEGELTLEDVINCAASIASVVISAVQLGRAIQFSKVQKAQLSNIEVGANLIIKSGSKEVKVGSPAVQARSWQGHGDYPGVDNWSDIILRKGTKVWGGTPGQSFFYTTDEVMNSVGNNATLLNNGLQVGKGNYPTFRPGMTMYELTEDITVGYSKALANPQYGAGGFDQYFISNYEEVLKPILTRIMI